MGTPRTWREQEADEKVDHPVVVDVETGAPVLDATSGRAAEHAAAAAAARHKRRVYIKLANEVYASQIDKEMFAKNKLADGSRTFVATEVASGPAEDVTIQTAYNHFKAAGVYGNPNAGVTVEKKSAWADYSRPQSAPKARPTKSNRRAAPKPVLAADAQLPREKTPRKPRDPTVDLPVGDTQLMRRALAYKRRKQRSALSLKRSSNNSGSDADQPTEYGEPDQRTSSAQNASSPSQSLRAAEAWLAGESESTAAADDTDEKVAQGDDDGPSSSDTTQLSQRKEASDERHHSSRSGKRVTKRKKPKKRRKASKHKTPETGVFAGLVDVQGFSFYDNPDREIDEEYAKYQKRLQKQRKARKGKAFVNTQWGVSTRTRELEDEEAKEERRRRQRSKQQMKKIKDKTYKPWREKPPKSSRRKKPPVEQDDVPQDLTDIYQTHLAQSVGTPIAGMQRVFVDA